jgi:hypothetical protein
LLYSTLTVPVNVGLKFAFKFNAEALVVDTGLFASDILSTFDKPTIDLVIPVNNAPLPTKH